MNATAVDATYYGVDVHSGSVRGDSQSYALVRLEIDGGDASIDRDVVSYRKLLREISREHPAAVATDNVYELAEDSDDLVRLLSGLPESTDLVQVTGAERPDSLSRVASRHDVEYGKKPIEEAEASAWLAAQNVGCVVRAYGDATRVKVSRGRSPGKGGSSADRYTRRIHGAVRSRAREIRDRLDEVGLDYDVDVTEKYGGYSNAVFDVDAPPSEVPASSTRSGDVRVEVSRPRRDGVEFEPLVERRDHVVVGVDPGTTTAAAVVSLDGDVLDVASSREWSPSAVVEWIVERGRPVLVASDVTPMPGSVESIRRSFDAAGWTPDSDPSVDEKKRVAAGHGCSNDHERDALAAALLSLSEHGETLDKVERKTPSDLDPGEVFGRVVAEERTVESVVAELRGSDEEDDETEARSKERERAIELERRVGELTEEIENLKTELRRRDERIDELEEEVRRERHEQRRDVRERREVKRLTRENERLRSKLDSARETEEELRGRLDRLKKLWRVEHSDLSGAKEGYVVVKVVDEFTGNALDAAEESFGFAEGDVVLLSNAGGAGWSTAERLASTRPRVVLVDEGELSEAADAVLFDAGVPVADADGVPTRRVDDLALAREEDVEAAVDEWREDAARRSRRESEEMVDELIAEYRRSRRES
ncbi:MAG: DUF460 domain-containing protein [Halobacteriota archaeon]